MTTRQPLPNRREHTTQKERIDERRTFYLSVHDDAIRWSGFGER